MQGGWIALEQRIISTSQSVVDFEGNLSWWNGTYEVLRFYVTELHGDVDGAQFESLLRIDGAYQSSPGDYAWGNQVLLPEGRGADGNPSDDRMKLHFRGVSNLQSNALCGSLDLWAPSSIVQRKHLSFDFVMKDSNGSCPSGGMGYASYKGADPSPVTEPLEGIRFQLSEGNVAAARFIVEGLHPIHLPI